MKKSRYTDSQIIDLIYPITDCLQNYEQIMQDHSTFGGIIDWGVYDDYLYNGHDFPFAQDVYQCVINNTASAGS